MIYNQIYNNVANTYQRNSDEPIDFNPQDLEEELVKVKERNICHKMEVETGSKDKIRSEHSKRR
jgi:hypothetical protein